MTRTPRRALSVLGAATLAVAVLSGCQAGPVRPGAAAVVGQDRIDTDRLSAVVSRGLADPQAQQQLGGDRVGYQRQVLSRMITSDLLQRAARRLGIRVTSGAVDARLQQFAQQLGGQQQLQQQAAQSGIAAQDLRPFVRDLVLQDDVADALTRGVQVPESQLRSLYQQNIAQYDKVDARHILVSSQAQARAILAQVRRNPAAFAAIARSKSLDTGSGAKGGELGFAGRGAYVPAFENALFSTPVGQFGIVKTQFGWHVFQVEQRQTTTFAQAAPELRRQALQQPRQQALGALLQKTARTAGVHVNPRFGSWDGQRLQVVDAPLPYSSPAASPAASSGARATQ